MFTETELFGDFAILHALRQQTDNVLFPFGQQPHSVCVDDPHRCKLSKSFHNLREFGTARPDLPRVDLLHAPA